MNVTSVERIIPLMAVGTLPIIRAYFVPKTSPLVIGDMGVYNTIRKR